MGFWASPSATHPITGDPIIDVADEGLDVPIVANESSSRGPHRVLSEEERKRAVAMARRPHSGNVKIDIRIFIVVAVLVIVGIVLYLFFRNMSKARAEIHKQIVAKQTAITLASQLQPFLPPSTMTASPSAHSKASGGPPVLKLTASSHPCLYKMLHTINGFQSMVDDNRADVWVIDRHGWVYADSRAPHRSTDATSHHKPAFNLYSLTTAPPEGKSKPPPNVGAAILQAAEHGPGLVNFLVPAQGVSGAAVSPVTVFVQPVPNTDFLVVVKVGHRTDKNTLPMTVPMLPTSSAVAPVSASAPSAAPPAAPAASASAPSASGGPSHNVAAFLQNMLLAANAPAANAPGTAISNAVRQAVHSEGQSLTNQMLASVLSHGRSV